MPRVLTLTPDVPLRETMLAFRQTRSDFAIVVESTGQDAVAPKTLGPTETFAANVRNGRYSGRDFRRADTVQEEDEMLSVALVLVRVVPAQVHRGFGKKRLVVSRFMGQRLGAPGDFISVASMNQGCLR